MKEKLQECLWALEIMNQNGLNFSNTTKELLNNLNFKMQEELANPLQNRDRS